MKIMKPALEMISPEFGSSFTVKQYIDPTPNLKQPFWHFHPELEIVYVKGGSGKRHVGNHMSYFQNGDLIFIGANLPHYGFTDRLTANESETIVQMREDFLGTEFIRKPEMENIAQLFERAKAGLSFYGATKEKVGQRLENLPKLDNFARLFEFLFLLQDLAFSTEYHILNADGFTMEFEHQDNDRVNVIYEYVNQRFRQPITLEEIANEVSMTVPAFCRYFKRLTGKTFTLFVNEYRVVHACKLLVEQPTSITDVCYESGFNNFSHFNRLFKEITGKTPSAYRKDFKKIIRGETAVMEEA